MEEAYNTRLKTWDLLLMTLETGRKHKLQQVQDTEQNYFTTG